MATQLVALPEVERLSASVIRILGANPGKFTLQGTNTYLVGRGHQRILIDSGQGEEAWAKNLQTVLTDEKATVHQALLTHWHGDHVGGVADLKRLCPQVQVFKCALELDGESEEYARIEDGQVFRVEGATLKALFTPGHTEDHMAFVLEEEDAIFTDVLGHGTAVFENLKVYLASLHRMRERVGGRGYPGHGAVLESAAVRIQEYIKHRQQREEEVIRVLRYGQLEAPVGVVDSEIEARPALTPLQVVKQIYVGVPESLHLPASHGVSLVLEKLREEGKTVQEASGAWRLVGGKSTL